MALDLKDSCLGTYQDKVYEKYILIPNFWGFIFLGGQSA
jgi:hypothetical protein